jgi:predicted ABC-type sugar transport system permease subunit
MGIRTRTKIALGSMLAGIGGLGIVLSVLQGWSAVPRPWGFLLGFVVGLLAGLGVALAVSGFVERRRDG